MIPYSTPDDVNMSVSKPRHEYVRSIESMYSNDDSGLYNYWKELENPSRYRSIMAPTISGAVNAIEQNSTSVISPYGGYDVIGVPAISGVIDTVEQNSTSMALSPTNYRPVSVSTPVVRQPSRRIAEHLLHDVQATFQAAADEDFEFGMDNEFTKDLDNYVNEYYTNGVRAISNNILRRSAEPRVIAEALRWLGSLNHRESHRLRLRTLEASLEAPSRWIRDGAGLGLAGLKDPHAIPFLRQAITRERLPGLRRDLTAVLHNLERAG